MHSPTEAINNHMSNTQNTHSSTAQASAARLIMLLRKNYSDEQQSTPSLAELEYMRANTSSLPNSLLIEPVLKNIQGILKFINYIVQDASFDRMQVKDVIAKISALANMGNDHWTKNSYYPLGSSDPVIIDSSLGETLNLVCLATFDTSAYHPSADGEAKDTNKRVLSLFNCLLNLPPEQCSGGDQHEILFLLNKCYQDIVLLEDVHSFLLKMISHYLSDALKLKFPDDKALFQFILPWIKVTANYPKDDEQPEYLAWLVTQKEGLANFLKKACESYCLNPAETKKLINMYMANLEDSNVPDELHQGVILARDLLKITRVNQTLHSSWLNKKAQAVAVVQATILKCRTCDEVVFKCNDFSIALQVATELTPYLNSPLAEEDEPLLQALQTLQAVLLAYFEAVIGQAANIPLPQMFQETKRTFETAKSEFKAANQVEFIKNLFAVLSLRGVTENQWTDAVLKLSLIPKTSIFVSDAVIQKWLQQYRNHSDEIEISPYEINRFILHAIFTHPEHWTANFCDGLLLVINWLKEPVDNSNPSYHLVRAVKQTYPRKLRKNLGVLIQIVQSNLLRGEKKALYEILLSPKEDENEIDVQFRFFSKNFFIRLFKHVNPNSFNQLWRLTEEKLLKHDGRRLRKLLTKRHITDIQWTQLWIATRPHLALIWAADIGDLLAREELTEMQKSQLWTEVKPLLPTIIKQWTCFSSVFTSEGVSEEHQRELLTMFAQSLPKLLEYSCNLGVLIEHAKSYDIKLLILEIMEPHLSQLIMNSASRSASVMFIELLKNKGLKNELLTPIVMSVRNDELRTRILMAVGANGLQQLIIRDSDLFSLFEQCNLSFRQQKFILTSLMVPVARISLGRLKNLMTVFNNSQRAAFLDALGPHLATIIGNSSSLYSLLGDLPNDPKTLVFHAVRPYLARLIVSSTDVSRLYEYIYTNNLVPPAMAHRLTLHNWRVKDEVVCALVKQLEDFLASNDSISKPSLHKEVLTWIDDLLRYILANRHFFLIKEKINACYLENKSKATVNQLAFSQCLTEMTALVEDHIQEEINRYFTNDGYLNLLEERFAECQEFCKPKFPNLVVSIFQKASFSDVDICRWTSLVELVFELKTTLVVAVEIARCDTLINEMIKFASAPNNERLKMILKNYLLAYRVNYAEASTQAAAYSPSP